MNPINVSGNIWGEPDSLRVEGELYVIRNPATGQGWGLPVCDITPNDLRALADRLESRVNTQKHRDRFTTGEYGSDIIID